MPKAGAAQAARVTIRPHRSYRTLRVSRVSWLGSAVTLPIGVLLAYAALLVLWPRATAWMSALLAQSTPITRNVPDNFLFIASTVPIPNLPPLSVFGALDVAGLCAAAILLAGFYAKKNAPLPLWIIGNLIVLLITALWAFFEGRAGYDGPTYMLLLERTSVIMILCSPIFAVVVAALLPFTLLERVTLFTLLIALDFFMSVLRLAVFALILTHTGVILETNLYLFLGPLIDVVYFIAVYSLVVVSLSRRLARTEDAWEWL